MFITFEGLDGAGKTTQAKELVSWLQELGYTVVFTREPGGTELGRGLRNLLLDAKAVQLSTTAEMLLMAADRAQHVQEVIRPALVNNKIVVCDRYVDSSLAYQGFGLGYDVQIVEQVNTIATRDLQPTITFLLDIEISTLVRRLEERQSPKDRIEERGIDFRNRVREGYLKLAAAHPDRIHRIDVNQSTPTETQDAIRALVREQLGIPNTSNRKRNGHKL